MIGELIFSNGYLADLRIMAVILGGIFFNIGFLILVFLAFKKKFKSYKRHSNNGIHTSVKQLNFADHNSDDTVEGPELLFYKASHDLKGPLKSIRGLVQLAIKDKNKNNHEIYLEKINETANGLEDFLEEILNLGRIKKQRKREKEIDLKNFINGIVAGFENYPGRNKIELNVDIKSGEHLVSDDAMLKSVFQNLIENAIKYHDDRKAFSELTITSVKSEEYISILFSDNGLGIAGENLPYIFDLFYRVDSIKEGSGLGLYIVMEALKKLNGKITARSRFGIGSEFIVEIPLKEKEENRNLKVGSEEVRKTGF